MNDVTNPIIIDQNYCDSDDSCHEQVHKRFYYFIHLLAVDLDDFFVHPPHDTIRWQRSAVQVSNVMYRNIRGTSASEVAMKFDCSRTHPCEEISLQGISLRRTQLRETAEASCANVEFDEDSMALPNCR